MSELVLFLKLVTSTFCLTKRACARHIFFGKFKVAETLFESSYCSLTRYSILNDEDDVAKLLDVMLCQLELLMYSTVVSNLPLVMSSFSGSPTQICGRRLVGATENLRSTGTK